MAEGRKAEQAWHRHAGCSKGQVSWRLCIKTGGTQCEERHGVKLYIHLGQFSKIYKRGRTRNKGSRQQTPDAGALHTDV